MVSTLRVMFLRSSFSTSLRSHFSLDIRSQENIIVSCCIAASFATLKAFQEGAEHEHPQEVNRGRIGQEERRRRGLHPVVHEERGASGGTAEKVAGHRRRAERGTDRRLQEGLPVCAGNTGIIPVRPGGSDF